MAHEFGHGTGGLADEYTRNRTYTGPEPSRVNVTTNTDRSTLKWRKFVRPSTPIPTDWGVSPRPAWWSSSQDVGLFEGGSTYNRGIYRPVENCRMNGNSPPFCPVCYTEMKSRHHTHTGRNFERVYCGDFNGDGKDDVLIHSENGIQLFRSNGSQLDLVFSAVDRVPGSWQFALGDRFFVGDFNGDGRDEVVVYNSTNWNQECLGLLVDDGNDGLELIRRYDDSMPGWQMAENDRYHVGDFTGDGKVDLWVANGTDWNPAYLGMLSSDEKSLSMAKRYDGTMPNWQMRKGDRHYVGDFDGDGKADLYVFNGTDWSTPYLGMLRSTGAGLVSTKRYDGNAPGWQMRKNDSHWVADIEGNGRADLLVYNATDWTREYLGTMQSTGGGLKCKWSYDWVGEWNLGKADQFEICDYEGSGARRGIIVHNRNWLGMMKATPALELDRIYYRWIHNYRHGRNW